MDELAHLPAGYSYLTQRDFRLNPEHPPLIKDLAALPLLFIKGIKFPSDISAWKDEINSQWDFGNYFLFKSGNPAEKMIFWGRIPMIFIFLVLGFYVFKWAKQLGGNETGLLTLFLYCLSPTFLAHARLVTTDVGAAAGITIATYYFLKFLNNTSKKSLIWAGLSLGLALLAKFSTILLLPFFGLLIVIKSFFAPVVETSFHYRAMKQSLIRFMVYCLKFLVILAVAGTVVWLVYFYHVSGYPIARQATDTQTLLSSQPFQTLNLVLAKAASIPVLRPLAQYVLGLIMVFQRGSGGNTTFFLGEINNQSWKNYFPVVYAIKEPLAFFILLIIGVCYGAWLIKKPFWQKPLARLKDWLNSYFEEFAMLAFIGFYWLVTLTGNLNIGVRHLLPVFPFTIILVGRLTNLWLKPPYSKLKTAFLAVLLLWQAVSVVSVFPYFLTYFNELAGGPSKGYLYVVDSNLDWGQDLKRLNQWAEQNKINKIYVDYFGGSDLNFYLGDKYLPWSSWYDPKTMTQSQYLAVSATFLQSERGIPVKGFNQPTGRYDWLYRYEPITIIGHSIFVYRVAD